MNENLDAEGVKKEKTGNVAEMDDAPDQMRKILALMRIDGALSMEVVRDLGEAFPKDLKLKRVKGFQLIADLSDDEAGRLLEVIKDKYIKNISGLSDPEIDESLRFSRFLLNFDYVRKYHIGDYTELLNALLDFGKKERSRKGSSFFENAVSFFPYFMDRNYFPDVPELRLWARDYILFLLEKASKEKASKSRNEEFIKRLKKTALNRVEELIKKGVLDEVNDADIIEKVIE